MVRPVTMQPVTRNSHGLDQFFASLGAESGLRLLDLSQACQANIGFITGQGNHLYTEDFYESLRHGFGHDFSQGMDDASRIDAFLAENWSGRDNEFDGALVWDALQYMTSPMIELFIDRLWHRLRPGAPLLALFSADEKASVIACSTYRIADAKTLTVVPRGATASAHFYNSRAIERLFQNFRSVKFFLARDTFREVLVKR